MHIHIHSNHNSGRDHRHDGPFSRISRDLGSVLDRLTGPGMTDQQRASRHRAEAMNERYGSGLM